jgi:pimeloyl-ACP methyl ester carboxylesterase
MLARMLRLLILVQILVGTGLGYLLVRFADSPAWFVPLFAIALPVWTMLMVSVITALKSRADERVSLWWRAVLGEFWAGVRIYLLRQPWTWHAPAVLPATGPQTRMPVVLVHGYLCNHRIWDDVARDLRGQGHSVLAVNLEPLFTSIDNYVPIIDAAVSELCRQTGASRVALVGHSMGGLAIRAWMRDHGTQRVARVLTLGTPHAGTRVEPNINTPNGQQMRWQSPWLADLTAREKQEARTLIRIALTPQDNIVFPQRAQVLPGVEPMIFEGIGHLQKCLNPAVIAWVRGQLAELAIPTPTPTQAPAPAA